MHRLGVILTVQLRVDWLIIRICVSWPNSSPFKRYGVLSECQLYNRTSSYAFKEQERGKTGAKIRCKKITKIIPNERRESK